MNVVMQDCKYKREPGFAIVNSRFVPFGTRQHDAAF